MKELTIQEKAKAYDEALKMAKEYWDIDIDNTMEVYAKGTMEHLFPELKESEDEKIRKALIKYFTLSDDNADYQCCGVHYKDIVAWLEKQDEHKKFRDSIQVGDKVTRNQDGMLVNLSQLKRIAKPNETKQGEQMPQGKSALEAAKEEKVDNTNKVEPKFKVGDKIQYSKGCDTIMTIEKIENGEYVFANNMGHTTIEWGNNWYLVEQKPAWSEEDKVMLDEIIDFFENGTVKLQHDLSLYASWLKSLTGRYTWKPSDEQMEVLFKYSEQNNYDGSVLTSLYQELKKLKE